MALRKNAKTKEEGNILDITKYEQYRTVDELFAKSRSSSSYYTLLGLSAIIVTSGLLLNSTPIVIGGMLVAPVLTPLLLIGLGLSLGQFSVVKRVSILMLRSMLLIIVISAVLALMFGHPEAIDIFGSTTQMAVLYFLVAISSGIAGTFALTRRELSVMFPGVAVAITLLPPLALMGIWMSTFNLELVRFYFLIFIFNVAGVVAGSLVVFALLGFYKLRKKVEAKEEKVEVEEEKKAKLKEKAKKEEKKKQG